MLASSDGVSFYFTFILGTRGFARNSKKRIEIIFRNVKINIWKNLKTEKKLIISETRAKKSFKKTVVQNQDNY